jgi:two-component system sensor histidine kinase UhpB
MRHGWLREEQPYGRVQAAMRGIRRLTLFGRIVLANAVVVATAAVLLAVTPFGISYPAQLTELGVLAIAVVLMIVADGLLVRRALAPFERLRESMRRMDPLQPGERLDVERTGGEMAELARGFNEMADRLEAERRVSTRAALEGREAERRSVARELHDEVGQTLTALLAQLERSSRRAPPKLRTELAEAQDVARASLEDVRRVVTRLRPDTLEDLGLVSALRALTRRMAAQTGLEISHHLDPHMPALDPQAELVVYRIAQEALTNAVRHAGAGRVEVTVAWGPGGVTLIVADDGHGLGPGGESASGIRGMRERALLVGGRLRIADRPEKGVEVRLDVPSLEAHR